MEKAQIIFHETYLKYSFGPNHPFWPERSRFFLKKLKKYRFPFEVAVPQKATDKEILLVHSPSYLHHLKQLAQDRGQLSIDTPITPENLESAYYSVGGSILALNLALEGKKPINLSGGWHHAGISSGSGFCLLNDHSIAIRKLQKEGKIKKAIIFDLDVHAGQGTQEIFYNDPKVLTISLHQDPATLYPGVGFAKEKGEGAGQGFNLNLPLPPGTGEKEYLQSLDSVLPLTKKFPHDIIIVVLGVDTYKDDPLAQINLEIDSYRKIGERFKKFPRVAVMFAGGYSKKTPDLWFSFLKGYL
ncbi:histone deacetylase family protein [Patescibacteria group bacterium]